MKIVWDVACSSQTILFSTCKNIFNSLKFSQKLHLFTPFKHELVCIFHIKLEFPPFNLTILFQLGVLYRVIFCLVNLSNNTLLKIHLKHTKSLTSFMNWYECVSTVTTKPSQWLKINLKDDLSMLAPPQYIKL